MGQCFWVLSSFTVYMRSDPDKHFRELTLLQPNTGQYMYHGVSYNLWELALQYGSLNKSVLHKSVYVAQFRTKYYTQSTACRVLCFCDGHVYMCECVGVCV